MRDYAVSVGWRAARGYSVIACVAASLRLALQRRVGRLGRFGDVENGQQHLYVFGSVQAKAGQVAAIG